MMLMCDRVRECATEWRLPPRRALSPSRPGCSRPPRAFSPPLASAARVPLCSPGMSQSRVRECMSDDVACEGVNSTDRIEHTLTEMTAFIFSTSMSQSMRSPAWQTRREWLWTNVRVAGTRAQIHKHTYHGERPSWPPLPCLPPPWSGGESAKVTDFSREMDWSCRDGWLMLVARHRVYVSQQSGASLVGITGRNLVVEPRGIGT